MQLVSLGIGPDRISDMTANLLKMQLVSYTREQCDVWGIPIQRGVPLHHIFDLDTFQWHDEYVDLPVNPKTEIPILFVPRRIVRVLPWINFEDYERSEFRLFLRAQMGGTRAKQHLTQETVTQTAKKKVITVTRQKLYLLDNYVKRKEIQGAQVEPELGLPENEGQSPVQQS